jgi:hypothetical protein
VDARIGNSAGDYIKLGDEDTGPRPRPRNRRLPTTTPSAFAVELSRTMTPVGGRLVDETARLDLVHRVALDYADPDAPRGGSRP